MTEPLYAYCMQGAHAHLANALQLTDPHEIYKALANARGYINRAIDELSLAIPLAEEGS